jgi:AraC-like DNA-binding protein
MPSSAVRTFTDPDEYAASAHGTTVQLTIVERGRFEAKIIRVDLHHLRMQRFADNLPRIVHSANDPGFATISLRPEPGPSLRRSGMEMLESNIIRRGQAETFFQQSDGPVCFGSMSLPLDVMAAVGSATVGCDLTPPRDALTVVPSLAALHRLQGLHEEAAQLAEHAPVVFTQLEAARGLEQSLIGAMLDCLGPGDVNEDRSALRQHTAIMRRFHGAIERHLDQPLYIPELCAEIGASERTLRVCCQEQLGMSPKRYLLLRRMHLVQRALRTSTRIDATVTDIATRYGFWQFGRFAGEYKALFGESPSAMLARLVE